MAHSSHEGWAASFLYNTLHEILKPTINSSDPNTQRICVFYQKDLMNWGLGEELLVEIKGVYGNPPRVPDESYNQLVATIKGKVANCEHAECTVDFGEGIVLHYSA